MFKLFTNKKPKKKERMGRSKRFSEVGNLNPKQRRVGLLGGKWSSKRRRVGLLGGKWSPKRHHVGHLGGNFWTERRRLQTCMSNSIEASSTRLSLFSLFESETPQPNWNSPSKHSFLSLSSRLPFQSPPRSSQTPPTTKSTLLKHSNFPNVTLFLAHIDTTTQETKKQPSKDKGQFTFPFSFVIFNFLWVDTMIGLSLWNILTLVHVS